MEDMTPNDIEILIHCHVSPAVHPRMATSGVREAYRSLEANGLIELCGDKEYYHTTDRGSAHISVLCTTPWPTQCWIDQNGNIIEI